VVWAGLMWLRIGANGELLWTLYWTFGFDKILGNFWIAERLESSQKRLSSMDLVSLGGRTRQWVLLYLSIGYNRCCWGHLTHQDWNMLAVPSRTNLMPSLTASGTSSSRQSKPVNRRSR
jgi:hypothetical protein